MIVKITIAAAVVLSLALTSLPMFSSGKSSAQGFAHRAPITVTSSIQVAER